MKLFKKIMLSMLIIGCASTTAFGMEDSDSDMSIDFSSSELNMWIELKLAFAEPSDLTNPQKILKFISDNGLAGVLDIDCFGHNALYAAALQDDIELAKALLDAAIQNWIQRVEIPKLGGGHNQMVVCNDAETLVYLANQAVITPHIFLSRIDKLDYPDRMIFDLDPSSTDDFATVCKTALRLKEIIENKNLVPFVMTTGSRGLHVVAPLIPDANFDSVRAYAREIADQVVAQDPQHLTTALSKRKRRGRVFIDVGRNAYAQTAVAPYAIRALPGAPVATPLHWSELELKELTSQRYTLKNIFQRLSELNDPWKNMLESARSLPK